MKSLLDIQQDIRRLENILKNITESIKAISSDIELIRTSEQDINIDFDLIKVLARNLHYGKHPISKIDDEQKQMAYIEMLITIVRFDIDKEAIVNRLVFIQWLLDQTKTKCGLEALYKNSLKMDDKKYYKILEDVARDYKEYFVLDSLIIANLPGTANMEIQSYIANTASIMRIDAKNIYILAVIAKSILCRSFRNFAIDDIKIIQANIRKFHFYLDSKNVKQEILISLRNIVVQLPDSEVRDFRWKVKQMADVIAGDIVATYKKETQVRGSSNNTHYVNKRVVAPVNGVIYIFRDSNVNYGVISKKGDNKEAIKYWIKTLANKH